MKYLLPLLLLAISHQVLAIEYFVHPNGGTLEQCNGTTNAPYNAELDEEIDSEAKQKSCAVNHLFELLDPQDKENAHLSGGDIVTIMNNEDGSAAEYQMGMHGIYSRGDCNKAWNYGCYAAPIPSGTANNPTIIRGQTADGQCITQPILYGTGRAGRILTIDKADHVEVSCLTLTDKSSCIGASNYPDESLICDRSEPYDKPFADGGMLIRDADQIKLTDLDIEGLSNGIAAGRLGNITLTRVNIFANFSSGWNGDINHMGGDGSSNTGTLIFKDSSINFNGCGLIYDPGSEKHNTPHACARQDIGGYGDGVGTGQTAGDWVFDNTQIMHNASDGLDLLYHSLGGKVVIKNSRMEGNAGNQLKIAGDSEIINNIIIGSCAWNAQQEAYLGKEGEICRAGGNALSISMTHKDTRIDIINNTVISQGDCIISSGNRTDVEIDQQKLNIVNNMFYGQPDWRQRDYENTCLYYTEEPFPIRQIHNNIIHMTKGYDDPCNDFQANIPSSGNAGLCTTASGPFSDNSDHSVATNPHYPNIDLGIRYSDYSVSGLERQANNVRPLNRQSPVINTGFADNISGLAIPTTDFYGRPRIGGPDIGAVEFYVKPKPPIIVNIEEVKEPEEL